ncbi:MAG: ADP-ribosylglycohydrolase family protein [Polaromonas sp.]|nr:ADP-ribosylglycohydrolase family protein [Polaromonas sp.]
MLCIDKGGTPNSAVADTGPSGLPSRQARLVGSLIGTAMGDAIGLPYEGLSRRRGASMLGAPTRQRLFFGRGMVSDDTEHACMTAQALIVSGGDVAAFRKNLASRLRWWLLPLPAGVGLATARAVLRLWVGISPEKSGVFSAGNGPAMRAPIIGAAIDDLQALRPLVRASTRLTHTDEKAEFGALAAALAAHMAARQALPVAGADFLAQLKTLLAGEGGEFLALMDAAVKSVSQRQTTQQFAAAIGLERGVSGYMFHTMPVVIHAWLMHQNDFCTAIVAIVECGGDTDSTAAILGGIVGASCGPAGIPADWQRALLEWPRSIRWMTRLGRALGRAQAQAPAAGVKQRAPELFFPAVLLRNVFFLGVVLFHGFRRLLPPY